MKTMYNKTKLLDILLDECEKTGHSLRTIVLELMTAHNECRGVVPAEDGNVIKAINKNIVINALSKNNGNQRATAKELGIPKSTLCDWLKKWSEHSLYVMKN